MQRRKTPYVLNFTTTKQLPACHSTWRTKGEAFTLHLPADNDNDDDDETFDRQHYRKIKIQNQFA